MLIHPSWVMFNPQPDPPGVWSMLNPQPLPPGALVTLNPQPLPPGPANPLLQRGIIIVGG